MEIERKFLVRNQDFKQTATRAIPIQQAYLASSEYNTVRIRIAADQAYLTIKGRSLDGGLSREEFEYPVPVDDARRILKLARPGRIEKTRYIVPFGGFTWEVDCFGGALDGLIIAEVELQNPQQSPELPPWIGREVTGDRRYYNSALSVATALPPTQ